MPRKRSAESEAPEPVPKRRSARQAGKNAGPAAARSETEIPKSAGKKGATGKGAGSNGANEAGQDAPDAPRHVVKGKAAAKPVKQKTTKSTAPKSEKVAGPAESARGARDVSEDPDIDSIPTRNPEVERHEGEWYWLMKAEPESRLENGIDVKFSIDDLRAREAPEPWDGIRSYAARNNLRAMNAGDKSFFYHSNCKEPGIVGIMEIVKEFSEDKSARRPGTAYYDPASTKEKPRWGLVHVKFLKKFAVPISLKELKEMGQKGELEDMQMLKQSRLSVSRVGAEAWRHLCEVADKKAAEAGLEHEVD